MKDQMEEEDRNDTEEKEMSFLDHMEILRWHLIRAAASILVFAVLCFISYKFIFDEILLAPKDPSFIINRIFCMAAEYFNSPTLCINSQPFAIININMSGQFSTHIMVAIVGGIIMAFPYISWELWRFFRPALYQNEEQHAKGAVFFTSFLFSIGVLFGYFIITPLSVHFLGNYQVSNDVTNTISLTSYISTITTIALSSGILFELPMAIYFLSKTGLVTPAFLRKYRKHSLVIILLLSAIITPPDIFSQILVCFPLVILYEISIKVSSVITKSKK